MWSRCLVGVIAARLVLASAAGAQAPAPPPGRIAASAAQEAAKAAAPRGPMPTGLKWTGIGLIAGSGGIAMAATISDCLRSARACRQERRAAYIVSGVTAATGIALLGLADARRGPPLPALEVGDGRAAIVQRIRF
jgi:hypothetical protein